MTVQSNVTRNASSKILMAAAGPSPSWFTHITGQLVLAFGQFFTVLSAWITPCYLQHPDGMVPDFPQREQIEGPKLQYLLTTYPRKLRCHFYGLLLIIWATPDSVQEG